MDRPSAVSACHQPFLQLSLLTSFFRPLGLQRSRFTPPFPSLSAALDRAAAGQAAHLQQPALVHYQPVREPDCGQLPPPPKRQRAPRHGARAQAVHPHALRLALHVLLLLPPLAQHPGRAAAIRRPRVLQGEHPG